MNMSWTRCFGARSVVAEHVRRGLGADDVVGPALERREVVTRFDPCALCVGQLDASALQEPQQRAARAVELALTYPAVDEGLREGGKLVRLSLDVVFHDHRLDGLFQSFAYVIVHQVDALVMHKDVVAWLLGGWNRRRRNARENVWRAAPKVVSSCDEFEYGYGRSLVPARDCS